MTETEDDGRAVELAEAADELNLEFKLLELSFDGWGFGVGAEVPLYPGRAETPYVGFGKVSGHWTLYYRGAGSQNTCSLVSVSRGVRVDASHRMPDLAEALRSKLQSTLTEVREATARVRAFRLSLGDV